MQNKYLEKIAGKMDAVKAGVGKFTRAFKGTDVADIKDLLKRTPVDKENLAARMDLSKRLGTAKKQTLAARGAVAATGTVATGGAVAASGKSKGE